MNSRLIPALALSLALGIGACSEGPVAPSSEVSLARSPGTGLVLDIVGAVDLPLSLGGTVTIDQAVITDLRLVEDLAGTVIGVEVIGTLSGTAVNALGETVAITAQPFVADLGVTSSGPGQCSALTLDLSSIDLDALGVVEATVPANVDVKASGAVGSLLCTLGQVLSGLAGGLTGGGIGGLLNGINNLI